MASRSVYRGFYFMNSKIENPLLTLNDSYAKVWDYMLRNMKPFNSIIFMQSIVAKEIGITPQFMSKVVRKLLSKGYIAKDGKQQHNVIYMVNPNYAWNGKADSKEAGNAKYARLLTENKGELKWK